MTSNSVIFLCIEGKKVHLYGIMGLTFAAFAYSMQVHKAAFWQDDVLLRFNVIFCHHDETLGNAELMQMVK